MAEQAWTRAVVTKYESLICQALARPDSKKTVSRLLKFTAELSNLIGKDWKLVLHLGMVAVVQACLKPEPSASAIEIDSGSKRSRVG